MPLVISQIIAFTTAIVIAATLVFVPSCDRRARPTAERLCEAVYRERVDGPIRLFAERGPKHRGPFLDYCVTLPTEYLACEAADISEIHDGCLELLAAHQGHLNNLLIHGTP